MKKPPKIKRIIIDRVNIGNDVWEITYNEWEECYCSRETKKAALRKDRMPLLKDLLRALN